MKILVAGAAGAVGRILVDKLVTSGHEVSGLIRLEVQREELKSSGVQGYIAELIAGNELRTIVADHDAVVFVAGSKGKALEAVDRDGAINLANMAVQSGGKRFVLLSSIYAGRPEEGPSNLQPYLYAKNAADLHIQKTGLDFTILRPGFLENTSATGKIEIAEAFNGPNVKISRTDVAEIIATSLIEPQTIGHTFEIIEGSVPITDALKRLEPKDK